MRLQGKSLKTIRNMTDIPKSTLSNWFKDVTLTNAQQIPCTITKIALAKARIKAVQWHNNQKIRRPELAKTEALEIVRKISITDDNILELVLAVLYLADGSKKNVETAIGSSAPETLQFS